MSTRRKRSRVGVGFDRVVYGAATVAKNRVRREDGIVEAALVVTVRDGGESGFGSR